MLRDPAPAEVLQLLSCNCKKNKCSDGTYICHSHGLKCSDLCNCTDCDNCKEVAESDNDDFTESDIESDSDSGEDFEYESDIEVDFNEEES